MLLNMAIADAYGAGFEFRSYERIKKYNNAQGYVNHSDSRISLAHYTDDTQMALALAELMLSSEEWTPLNVAQFFVDCFHRDPRKGYAGGFYDFLQKTHSGADFLKHIKPHSDKSGACMRCAPLGLFSDIKEVIEKTKIQASVTHNTTGGIHCALGVALASHYFIYDLGDKKDLPDFLASYVPEDWSQTWQGEVSVLGMDCAQAAISAVCSSDTLTELLIKCVSFTGDTDTFACIAFGISAYAKEMKNDLADALYTGLENGEYGRDYLVSIDHNLRARFLPTHIVETLSERDFLTYQQD